MGKAFRKALDRRGTMSRNVGDRTMMSSTISVLLELEAALSKEPELKEHYVELLEELRRFSQTATGYLKGGR